MKYLILLGDGMADLNIPELNNKTPLYVANKPLINKLAKKGFLGMVKTVPNGMKPGSDVANLSLMGYSPDIYYTGRSPLEAANIGIDLLPSDLSIRCNLVSLSEEEIYEEKTMVDYSSSEISTENARVLMKEINDKLGSDILHFYTGTSYRNCLIMNNAETGTEYTPPHDISSKKITNHLPKGINGDLFQYLMKESYKILSKHPINIELKKEGKNPANSIWLWGEGRKPALKDFYKLFNKKSGVISAVDLIKGIGRCANMKVYDIEGATGTLSTNYANKAATCIKGFLEDDLDFIYLHVEASDECGHQGDLNGKIKAIENLDSKLLSPIMDALNSKGVDLAVLVTPDHPTPIATRTHSSDPVPFLIYKPGHDNNNNLTYCEDDCKKTGIYFENGQSLINYFFKI